MDALGKLDLYELKLTVLTIYHITPFLYINFCLKLLYPLCTLELSIWRTFRVKSSKLGGIFLLLLRFRNLIRFSQRAPGSINAVFRCGIIYNKTLNFADGGSNAQFSRPTSALFDLALQFYCRAYAYAVRPLNC